MGLESITGDMVCPLSDEQLRELFPGQHNMESLAVRRRPVDYMIGMDQSSWLPEKYSKSESMEGNLWLWSNDFGKCVAGRHPWVTAGKDTNTMFSVLNTLHSYEKFWPDSEGITGVSPRLRAEEAGSRGASKDVEVLPWWEPQEFDDVTQGCIFFKKTPI